MALIITKDQIYPHILSYFSSNPVSGTGDCKFKFVDRNGRNVVNLSSFVSFLIASIFTLSTNKIRKLISVDRVQAYCHL